MRDLFEPPTIVLQNLPLKYMKTRENPSCEITRSWDQLSAYHGCKRPSENSCKGWMVRSDCASKRLSKPVGRTSCGHRPPGGSIAAIIFVMEAI